MNFWAAPPIMHLEHRNLSKRRQNPKTIDRLSLWELITKIPYWFRPKRQSLPRTSRGQSWSGKKRLPDNGIELVWLVEAEAVPSLPARTERCLGRGNHPARLKRKMSHLLLTATGAKSKQRRRKRSWWRCWTRWIRGPKQNAKSILISIWMHSRKSPRKLMQQESLVPDPKASKTQH